MDISRNEEEGRIIHHKRTEDEEETETDRAKDDRLTIAEQTRELVCLHCHKPIPTNEAFGTDYLMLADNRWLCVECKESAVMVADEYQTLHFEIREFFKGLNMKVEKVFPLILVDQQALNKAEEENIPRGANKQLIGMARESQRFVRECDVTAILILYGLPKGGMEVLWFDHTGYRNLKTVLEEGICQVLGRIWLESQRFSSSNVSSSASSSSGTPPPDTTSTKRDHSDFEKKLVEFCIHQIETDESPIYGDGFKKVNEMLVSNHYNLKDTLKGIAIASKTLQDSKF
ncbi:hypothetical protein Bca4012_065777 [Brassica carinata]